MAEDDNVKTELVGIKKDLEYMKKTIDRIENGQGEVVSRCITKEEFENWKKEVEELKVQSSTIKEREAYTERLRKVEKMSWAIMLMILSFVLLGIMGSVINFAGVFS